MLEILEVCLHFMSPNSIIPNSGPAFRLSDGAVVGVALQGSPGYQNICFFIPVNVVQRFLSSVKKGERTNRCPSIGFSFQCGENLALRRKVGLDMIDASKLPKGILPSGVYVDDVNEVNSEQFRKEKTSNDHIGLKKKDYVLALNGIDVGYDGTIDFE